MLTKKYIKELTTNQNNALGMLVEQYKNQLDSLGINWVELRSEDGFRRFKKILEKLKIPHQYFLGNLHRDLNPIFDGIFK